MRIRTALVPLVIGIAVLACDSSSPSPAPASPAAPSAAATASPPASAAASPAVSPDASAPASVAPPSTQPSPAAAAVDAATAFTDLVGDPLFSTTVDIDGRATVGKVVTTTSGTLEVSSGSRHLVVRSKTGRSTTTLETVSSGGNRYRMTDGVWVQGASADDDVVASLRAATTVTDAGVVDKDGQQLHHLVITPPDVLPAEATPGGRVSHPRTTMDAWVQEDGTPVLLTIGATWNQKVGGKTVSGTKSVDFAFSGVGEPVTVTVPTDLWAFYTSRRYDYRMGYPADWRLEKGTRKYADSYYGFEGDAAYASSGRSFGLTLSRLSSAITKYLPEIKGVRRLKITGNKPAKLGSLAARKIEFNYRYQGIRYWSVAYLGVRGGTFYLLSYETTSTTTDDHRAMAATFAGTFAPR